MPPFPAYLDQGAGFPILFSPGTRFDATMFAPQLAHLAAQGWRCVAQNSRVLLHDPAPHDLDDLVADTIALMDRLSLSRVVLAGMSVGAFMALQMALDHPERVAGLILISGHAGAFALADRMAWKDGFKAADVAGFLSPELAAAGADYCFGPTTLRENPGLPAYWSGRWQRCIPSRAVYHQFHSWVDKPSQMHRLSTLSQPVVVVHGAEDAVIAPDEAKEMADRIPRAEFCLIPKAGHSVNLEAPEAVNVAIALWLDKLRRGLADGQDIHIGPALPDAMP